MSTERLDIVKAFLSNEKILLVEPNPIFKQTVVSCLEELGAQREFIFYAKKYNDAVQILKEHTPAVLLTEYYLESRFGLSLVNIQSENSGDKIRIAILVTHNSADSAAAQAAEEEVDDYILKPFSQGELKERLLQVIYKKSNPTEYVHRIREGKKYINAKELDLAREEFKMALQFDKKTTLAHYYLGYVDFLQSGYDSALKHYNSGLKLQSLHYKCLLGLFDAMFEQKLYSDAYSLVPTIRENFPISPKRLGNIFICAVFSHNLKDVRQFFDIYQRLDDKPKELVKLFSAALLTAGRFYIQKNDRQTAFECFDLGLTVTGPVVSYLDTIIRQFLKLEDGQRAQMFLAKFPAEEVGGPAHSTLSFLVDWYLLPAQDVIEKGKKLVAQGYADKECFRALVKVCLNHGRKTAAEDAASKAVIKYPEIREEIYRLFEPQ